MMKTYVFLLVGIIKKTYSLQYYSNSMRIDDLFIIYACAYYSQYQTSLFYGEDSILTRAVR